MPGKSSDRPKLTPKQDAFVREYLVDLNATAAAKRAGYSKHTAASIGHENLRKPKIAAAIAQAKAERAVEVEITADQVLRRLASIAFTEIGHVASWEGNKLVLKDSERLDEVARGSIVGVKEMAGGRLEIKQGDPMRALDLLGRHLGMWDGLAGQSSAEDNARNLVDAAREMFSTVPPPSPERDADRIVAEIEAMSDDEVAAELERLGVVA